MWGGILVLLFLNTTVLAARCTDRDSAEALGQFQAHVQELLRSVERWARVGVVIADGSGRPYVAHNPEVPLVPASVTKLFWSAAALALMGDTATVRTRVLADAPVDAAGVVRGNLYLVGGGDAMLTVQELEELAAELVRRGVRRVTGAVLGDGSFFDGQRSRMQYSGDRELVQPLPPITALGFNRNEVRILISAVRGRVTAQTVPFSPAFVVDVSAVRVLRYRKRRQPSVRLSAQSTMQGMVQRIVLRGWVVPNGMWSLSVPMELPEAATAGTFLQRLRAAGVQVDGGFGVGVKPRDGVVLGEYRRPLAELLSVVNKESDNFLAEHLFKLVGAMAEGQGTHAEKARSFLQALLYRWGIPCAECWFADGSGLSRRNRVSAAAVVGLLARVRQMSFAQLFQQSLAIAGVDGTLRRRLVGTELAGQVTAKTGTLRDASGLAGYTRTADGEPIVFAILSFGNVRGAKAVEDSLVAAIGRFSFCGSGVSYSR